jgi:hypothetical protein
MAVPTKDAVIRIGFGMLYVQIMAEGHAGNPDVLDDMTRRAITAFKEAATAVVESGLNEAILDGEEEVE